MKNKFGIKGTFLDLNYLLHILPEPWKRSLKHWQHIPFANLNNNDCQRSLLKASKGSRLFYDKLIAEEKIPYISNKWQLLFPEVVFEWSNIFTIYRNGFKDTKLMDFQYRFLQRIIYKKKELLKMKIINNSLCSFCNNVNEDISHVYWECKVTQGFWEKLQNWVYNSYPYQLMFSKLMIFFGTPHHDRLLNHIIIAAKRHIYTSNIKNDSPNLPVFVKNLKEIFFVEKHIAVKSNTINAFTRKWNPLIPVHT